MTAQFRIDGIAVRHGRRHFSGGVELQASMIMSAPVAISRWVVITMGEFTVQALPQLLHIVFHVPPLMHQ